MRTAAGILLMIAGVIWILQGFDFTFAPQSFMTGDRWWVVWGSVATASGMALIWWDRRID